MATQTGISTTQKILIGSAMFFGAAAVAAAGFAGTPQQVPKKTYFNGAAAAKQTNGTTKTLPLQINHVYRLGDVNGGLYYFANNSKLYQIVGYYDAWKNTVVDSGEIVTTKQFAAVKGEAGFVRPRPGSTLIAFTNTSQFPDLYVSAPGGVLRQVTTAWAKQYFGSDWAAKVTTIDNFEYGKVGSMWVDYFGFKLGLPISTITTNTYTPSSTMTAANSISLDLGL